MRSFLTLAGLVLALSLSACDDGNVSLDEVEAYAQASHGSLRIEITEKSNPLFDPGYLLGFVEDRAGRRLRFCVQETKRGLFESDMEGPCPRMSSDQVCAGIEVMHDLGDPPTTGSTVEWNQRSKMAKSVTAVLDLKGPDVVCPVP